MNQGLSRWFQSGEAAKSFDRWAEWSARQGGAAWFFLLSVVLFILWIVLGPAYAWSTAWNFAGNQPMTTITFFLGILILHTQIKDSKAIHLQLREIIKALDKARNEISEAPDLPEKELDHLKAEDFG
jgi:low affinity Fe/Cu permease